MMSARVKFHHKAIRQMNRIKKMAMTATVRPLCQVNYYGSAQLRRHDLEHCSLEKKAMM